MKPAPFSYHDPRTLLEAVSLLAELEDARVLAGGQSLMPMLNMRVVQPANVVDLNRVGELSYIRMIDGELEIGAMTRQRDIEFSDLVRTAFPLMHEAVRHVGHRQTRNRGTLGGSLCQLDPSAELVSMAAAVDARVWVASKKGVREIPFAKFPRGLMTPAIDQNEIVTAVRFPLWKPGHGFGFEEFARRHGDFAIASAAALVEMDGKRIRRCRVTVSGIHTQPQTLPFKLDGEEASAALFEKAAKACDGLEAMDDAHLTAGYRRQVAGAMVRRALKKAHGRIAQR